MRVSKSRKFLVPPKNATLCAQEYFEAATADLNFFHFICDTALVGDYVAHIAKEALAKADEPRDARSLAKKITPADLAQTSPGSRIQALRRHRQRLLEMFLARSVDNFNRYLVDLIRAVLRKQPAILKTRQQTLTLEEILAHPSIDDLVHSIIEARVNVLSYEGFDSILEWCNDRGIPVTVPTADHQPVIELLATRNLIAHNRCIVDERYLRLTKNTKWRVGEKRELDVDDYWECLKLLHGTVIATDAATAKKYRIRRMRAKKVEDVKNPVSDGEQPVLKND
jgi:hypothetical protein